MRVSVLRSCVEAFNLITHLGIGMAETKKFDPFKPAQPSIPGVPAAAPAKPEEAAETSEPEEPRAVGRRSIPSALWVVIGLAVVVVLGGIWMFRSSGPDSKSQSASDALAVASAPERDADVPPEHLPVAPGIIGATKDIERPWSSKRFLFRSDLSPQPVPALVVHLPNGQYWGLSMIEPFGSCQLEYVTDLNVLSTEYDFRANHPMVGDPCTHTVFDLLQYAPGAPDGGLVRGAIVHGAGVRPPMAIEIDVDGKNLRAVRME